VLGCLDLEVSYYLGADLQFVQHKLATAAQVAGEGEESDELELLEQLPDPRFQHDVREYEENIV